MHIVNIYRDNLLLFGIKPEADSVHYKKIMGENELRLNFVENQFINFKIGDRANVFGENFYLNTLPVVTKISSREYNYQMVLQSTRNVIERVQYLFLGDDNSLKEGEFSLTGTAQDFLNLIINNTKRLLPVFNFTIRETIDDSYRTLTFASENCLEALEKVAEAFNTEYWIEGLEISLTKKQTDTGYTFRHGKQKGLYEITRQTVDNEPVITRLYAFGSDKNLPEGYRNYSKYLKLPEQPIRNVTNLTWFVIDNGNGTQSFTFDYTPAPGSVSVTVTSREVGSSAGFANPVVSLFGGQIVYTTPLGNYEFQFRTVSPGNINHSSPFAAIASTAQPVYPFTGEVIYLEKNIELYGVREATAFFDEVYPHRTGTVTAVNGSDPFEFSDSSMDFNVNDYLLPGLTAKVTFNSGQLSGYTFEISSYDNSLKKFIILENVNERVLDVPSADLRPAVGDKYVIVDIYLPQSYIDAAEAELQAKAQAMLDRISEPQLAYQLIFDPVYLKEQNRQLTLGDLIWIIDDALQLQKKIRIVAVQRNIIEEYQYTIDVADYINKSKIQSLVFNQKAQKNTTLVMSKSIQRLFDLV